MINLLFFSCPHLWSIELSWHKQITQSAVVTNRELLLFAGGDMRERENERERERERERDSPSHCQPPCCRSYAALVSLRVNWGCWSELFSLGFLGELLERRNVAVGVEEVEGRCGETWRGRGLGGRRREKRTRRYWSFENLKYSDYRGGHDSWIGECRTDFRA